MFSDSFTEKAFHFILIIYQEHCGVKTGNTTSKERQENGTSHTKHRVPNDIMELEVHKTQDTDWYSGGSTDGSRMSL